MTHPLVIAPSLLAADFACLGEEVRAIEHAGADWVHFDVMDQHFVPNLTFGPMVCSALKPHSRLPIDVHLMVEKVDELAQAFAQVGANSITFHPEACYHVQRSLSLIRQLGCQAGIVLNPATSLDWVTHILDDIDLVLLMSVNPGFGGQQFLPATLPKIQALASRFDAYEAISGRRPRLQVDGGVTAQNAAAVRAAGADTLVAGSAIFGHSDYAQAIAALRR